MSNLTKSVSLLSRLRSKRVSLPILLVAALLVIIGFTATAWALLSTAAKATPPALSTTAEITVPAITQDSFGGARLEAEVIIITPTGFEPTEITRPTGRFLLAIQDRSGFAEITLRVSRESDGAQFLVPTRKKHRAWRDVINPPSGRYLLTEANHPEWRCLITIQ
jgi:hypothetical protein